MLTDLAGSLLDTLTGLSPTMLVALTAAFTTLETSALIGLLIPGDAIVLLAGTTAASPARFAALVGAAVAGSLTGESVGYLLCRRYGDRLRSSRLGRRLGEPNWARAQQFLGGRGGRAVFAARFVAVVYALLPMAAGTVGMPYRRFVGWARQARWPGRRCTSVSARPLAPPGGSTATGSAWPPTASWASCSPAQSWPGPLTAGGAPCNRPPQTPNRRTGHATNGRDRA